MKCSHKMTACLLTILMICSVATDAAASFNVTITAIGSDVELTDCDAGETATSTGTDSGTMLIIDLGDAKTGDTISVMATNCSVSSAVVYWRKY